VGGDCGGGDRGSLGPIVVARSAIFSRLRRRHVAPRCTVGWQLSPPPPDHSCPCLTHSFAAVALLAAALADASCALFACRRFSTARPRSAGADGRRVCGNVRCDWPPIRCEAGAGALCRDFCAAACSLGFGTQFLRWCSCMGLWHRPLCTRGLLGCWRWCSRPMDVDSSKRGVRRSSRRAGS
jgi:hypothetical protein